MSDVSWDPSADPEVPTADAIEQRQPLPGEDEEEPELEGFELPDEANEADAVEQHEVVAVDDDEDAYR